MKKTYIAPVARIYNVPRTNFMTLSLGSSEVTGSNKGDFIQYAPEDTDIEEDFGDFDW